MMTVVEGQECERDHKVALVEESVAGSRGI